MASNNYFNLTLDTIAPVGSINIPSAYCKTSFTVNINKGDASYMKCWVDNTALPTSVPAGVSIENAQTQKTFSSLAEGVYFAHLVLIDSLGNESAILNSSTSILADNTAGTITAGSVKINDGALYSNHTINNKLTFSFTDSGNPVSGIVSYTLTGDIVNSPRTGNISNNATSVTLTDIQFTTGDGVKTINVTVTDASGNVSASVSDSINLDTTPAGIKLYLEKNTDTHTSNHDVLPAIINNLTGSPYVKFQACIDVTTTPADVVAYKLWGTFKMDSGSSTVDAPTSESAASWVNVAETTDPIIVKNLSFATTDGTYNVYCSVKDKAGNITQYSTGNNDLTESRIVDNTKPTASISVNKQRMSAVSGYNSIIVSYSATDTHLKNFKVSLNDTQLWTSGTSGNITPESQGLTQGVNTLKIEASDTSSPANTITKTCTFIYDTACPVVSFATLPLNPITSQAWHKEVFNVNLNNNGTSYANDITNYKVWISKTATDTTVPENAINVAYTTPDQTISSSSIVGWPQENTSSDGYYFHVQAVDTVGNTSYAHSTKWGWDTIAPVLSSVEFVKRAYASTTAVIDISYSDTASGVYQMQITGTGISKVNQNAANINTWINAATSANITLASGDGIKSLSVQVMDKAGNVSTVKNASTELDTTKPTAEISLYSDSSATIPLNDYVSIPNFTVKVKFNDNDINHTADDYWYKIYGDFTETLEAELLGTSEPEATWVKFASLSSGQTETGLREAIITDLMLTKNFEDETEVVKTIYVKVKDNAGNISDPVSATVVYDTAIPEVTISNVDYNNISKVHTLRRTNATTTVQNKYNDEVNFTFTPDCKIIAYKVCAYLDQVIAGKVKNPETESAIPTTAGSVNMSATGIESSNAVSCKIKGQDFETALKTANGSTTQSVDGIRYVVVYVKDQSGQWSAAASFSV